MAKKKTTTAKNKSGAKKTAAKKTTSKKAEVKKEEASVAEVKEEALAEMGTPEEVTLEETVDPSLSQDNDSELEETQPEVQEEVVHKDPPAKEETYKDRLMTETLDLRDKMAKLKDAVENNKVPASEVDILNEQYDAMHAYYIILNKRLGRA